MTALVADGVPFVHFCNFLDSVVGAKDAPRRRALLSEFFADWRTEATRTGSQESPHAVLRLLAPDLDDERHSYQLKETRMVKLVEKTFGLAPDHPELAILRAAAEPSGVGPRSDFSAVFYEVVKARCLTVATTSTPPSLTVINSQLDRLAESTARMDQSDVFVTLLRTLPPRELRWVMRIILKDMRLKVYSRKILSIFHPQAEELYNANGNLRRVCDTLADPQKRVTCEAQVLHRVAAMKAARLDLSSFAVSVGHAGFSIETKFDGERMQLHYSGSQFRYFSRNGKDYTSSYGASNCAGELTPAIAGAFSHVSSVILDGEMLEFDKATSSVVKNTKALNYNVKSTSTGSRQHIYCAFDILYLDGRSLLKMQLSERLDLLDSKFTSIPGRFMVAESTVGRSLNDAVSAFNAAVAARDEGIMVKRLDSTYVPDARGCGWFKVKSDYYAGTVDTLDLLILGTSVPSSTTRTGLVFATTFLCGLAQHDDDTDVTTFVPLDWISSGFSEAELVTVNRKLLPHLTVLDPLNPPSHLPGVKHVDYYVPPQYSVVLEVRAADIVPSSHTTLGRTLRFPRLERMRDDKTWCDVTTVTEFNQMCDAQAGKGLLRSVADHTDVAPASKRRRVDANLADIIDVKTQPLTSKGGSCLTGERVCVLNTERLSALATTHRDVERYGGQVDVNHTDKTTLLVAAKETASTNAIARYGVRDVLSVDWLRRCFDKDELYPRRREDYLVIGRATKNRLALEYDEFGDPYIEPTEVEDLKRIMSRMKAEEDLTLRVTCRDLATAALS